MRITVVGQVEWLRAVKKVIYRVEIATWRYTLWMYGWSGGIEVDIVGAGERVSAWWW